MSLQNRTVTIREQETGEDDFSRERHSVTAALRHSAAPRRRVKKISRDTGKKYYRVGGKVLAVKDEDVNTIAKKAIAKASLPDTLPLEEGELATRQFLAESSASLGVGVSYLLQVMKGATVAVKDVEGLLPDHRVRLKAVDMFWELFGGFGTKSGDGAAANPSFVNVNVSEASGVRAPATLTQEELVQKVLLTARAIAAGARNEKDVENYIANSPLPVVTEKFLEARREAETILEHFTPALQVQEASE